MVDIGYGSGNLAFEILDLGASTVTGIDVAEGAIEVALQRAKALEITSPEAKFECGLIGTSVKKSEPTDAVVGLGFAEHVHADDPDAFVSTANQLTCSYPLMKRPLPCRN